MIMFRHLSPGQQPAMPEFSEQVPSVQQSLSTPVANQIRFSGFWENFVDIFESQETKQRRAQEKADREARLARDQAEREARLAREAEARGAMRCALVQRKISEFNHLKNYVYKDYGFNSDEAVNLEGFDLKKVDFKDIHLPNANLKKADLRGVDLRGADLSNAELEEADLRGADLRGANLKKADLKNAKLQGAMLEGRLFQGQESYTVTRTVYEDNDHGSSFEQYSFSTTSSYETTDTEYRSVYANLQGAKLRRSQVEGVELTAQQAEQIDFQPELWEEAFDKLESSLNTAVTAKDLNTEALSQVQNINPATQSLSERQQNILQTLKAIPGIPGLQGNQAGIDYNLTRLSPLESINTRVMALRRLWMLERERGWFAESKEIYPKTFREDLKPLVKTAALIGMIDCPDIRPTDYPELLMSALIENEHAVLRTMALRGMIELHRAETGSPNSFLQSRYLNRTLELLSNDNDISGHLRKAATELLTLRSEMGLYHPFEPQSAAQDIAEKVVGNKHITQGRLPQYLKLAMQRMDSQEHQDTSLNLLLEGKPGIGKTHMAQVMANAIFGYSPGSLVTIDLGKINSRKDLENLLRAHGIAGSDGRVSLGGKLLLFDEFQELDNKSPQVRAELYPLLKTIFGRGEVSPDFSFKEAIAVIATNTPVTRMAINHDAGGEALVDRIKAYAKPLPLKNDLRETIGPFVTQFALSHLYEKDYPAMKRLVFDGAALQYLKQQLHDEYAQAEGPVNGRQMVATLMEEVELATAGLPPLKDDEHFQLSFNEETGTLEACKIQVEKEL